MAQDQSFLPALNPIVSVAPGITEALSPSRMLSENPRVDGEASVTLTGSVTEDDVVSIALECGVFSGGEKLIAVTAESGDTLTSLAQKLAAAINDDAACKAARIRANSLAAVVAIKWEGPVSTKANVDAWAESPSQTLTVGGTATNTDRIYVKVTNANLPGGSKTIFVAITTAETTTQMATAIKDAINADEDLAAEGITATSSTNVVTAASESEANAAFSKWLYQVAKTVTVGGTVTALEEVLLTITNAELPEGEKEISYKVKGRQTATIGGVVTEAEQPSITVTSADLPGGNTQFVYTVENGDDAAAVALGFRDLINADEEMIEAGITATASGAVLSIHYPGSLATVTFAKVDGANTTVTLAAAATAETGTTVAAAIAALIEADEDLQDAGFSAESAAAVVTVTNPNDIGEITYARTDGANTTLTLSAIPTETLTIAGNATELAAVEQFEGGSGPIIPLDDVQTVIGGVVHSFRAGVPALADGEVLSQLVIDGAAIA